jgi:dTDP-4-amino-4,6-dideoxygalactose transaminase
MPDTAYKNYPRTILPNTKQLVNRGLISPFYVDMAEPLIDEIVGQLSEILETVRCKEELEVL